MPKRMRIFAGPNGSGKTSIINRLKDKISFGNYINADDIEFDLINNGYQLPSCLNNIESSELNSFIKGASIIKTCNRTFLFDNSGSQSVYFAEITEGEQIDIRSKEEDIPDWFFKYVL